MADILDQLSKEIADLQQTRDELRVKLHLAGQDAKDEWDRLEGRLLEAEDRLKDLREQAKEPAQDARETARAVVDDLKEGFARIRSRF